MAITILVDVMQVGGPVHTGTKFNDLTLHRGYALIPARVYASNVVWYKPFWSPLGIQDSTDQNQVVNKSSPIYE